MTQRAAHAFWNQSTVGSQDAEGGGTGVLAPIHGWDAYSGQHPVDQTIVGKQGFENHRVGDKRRGAGQENHRAVDALALDVRAVEQLRQDQCQDQHNGHLDHKIENRVKQALLERGIL